MSKNYLLIYSEQLATDIELLCQSIKAPSNTLFQIRKSSSSVYANIREANYGQSKADMLSKFEIMRPRLFLIHASLFALSFSTFTLPFYSPFLKAPHRKIPSVWVYFGVFRILSCLCRKLIRNGRRSYRACSGRINVSSFGGGTVYHYKDHGAQASRSA